MGIESDQVVYEYLSRVGDVAQQRQLPSADRMRLVARLRDEIDRRRARAVVDSPAAVRRIISRLGTPDEVVTAASEGAQGSPEPAAPAPRAAVPLQRDGERGERGDRGRAGKGVLRKVIPRTRPADQPDGGTEAASSTAAAAPAARERTDGPSPPHRAGMDEMGDTSRPDWWQVDRGPLGVGDEVPGFTGGIEIPELLRPPQPRETEEKQAEPETEAELEAEAEVETEPTRRRSVRLLSRKRNWQNPMLLLAAGLLVAGTVLGNLFVLLFGWLIAYASRRLTPAEVKWAVVILPGLALTSGVVWLWGRTNRGWGDPIAEGAMNEAIAETWPWVVRGAALASAAFLVWRSQRRR
ncbi:membrane protein [Streptomyces thermocarboxydovorans]|uniref:Membrane protein n=1 Tax=Streptomyces thermocarboxydovorans TaxID=59298 RepID=A0ABN1HE10_9ACTN